MPSATSGAGSGIGAAWIVRDLDERPPGAGLVPETFADDFEWIVPEPLDGSSLWRGREGFVEFTHAWTEQFEDWSIRVERLIDAGEDRVVALTHQTATGKKAGCRSS